MIDYYKSLNISLDAIKMVEQAELELKDVFKRIEETELVNQMKVLKAFQSENIALRHFSPTTGYGYDDIGREALGRVFARALGAQDAIVRPHFASGTHAIYTALSGVLLPEDELLCVSGLPYDTLQAAIGITGDEHGSLIKCGVKYTQIELNCKGELDMEAISAALATKPRLVYLQRSRGYEWRNAFLVPQIGALVKLVRQKHPDAIIMVDNCYGEFTDVIEPCDVGVDVIIGSLIKNPGGGIAPTGAYIAGKSFVCDMIANRMTAPGIGREVGSYNAPYTPFFQGLFLAPRVTADSLKTAALFSKVFESLGMKTMPRSDALRADIIQAVELETEEALVSFCKSVQACAPIDSNLTPEPWDMPGYSSKVIMAAGAFVQGASIELSADAPIKPPYIAYVQGALTYSHGKLGVMMALGSRLV